MFIHLFECNTGRGDLDFHNSCPVRSHWLLDSQKCHWQDSCKSKMVVWNRRMGQWIMALWEWRVKQSSSWSSRKNRRLWWSRTSKEAGSWKSISWCLWFIRVLDSSLLNTSCLGLFPDHGNFHFQVLLDDNCRHLFLTFFHKRTRILLLLERTQRKACRVYSRTWNEHVCWSSKEWSLVQYLQQAT